MIAGQLRSPRRDLLPSLTICLTVVSVAYVVVVFAVVVALGPTMAGSRGSGPGRQGRGALWVTGAGTGH